MVNVSLRALGPEWPKRNMVVELTEAGKVYGIRFVRRVSVKLKFRPE